MKWENKTYELTKEVNKLTKVFEKYKDVFIFGAGLIGTQILEVLRAYNIFGGFIDNNIEKQKSGYKGNRVFSLEEYVKTKNGMIILAVSEKNMPDIIRQLENIHMREGKDFITYTKFNNVIFPIVSLYIYDKAYIGLVQISLTERCTLKCKKCAHGCFAVDNTKVLDLSLEQVYKSADSFFSKVDFVQEFVLIGGEPLLYQNLADVIRYIGKKYGQQIGTFSITTNGTIIPNKEVIKMCTDHNVVFHISNYSKVIPKLQYSYNRLIEILNTNFIKYTFNREDVEWIDYGFEYVDRQASKDVLIEVFDACKTPCREIRENRLYFCVMARSVSENMGLNVGRDDYLDLDSLQGADYKKKILEFNLGYSEKGYLDMCNYCHGAEAINYRIPAAEQG